MSTQGAGVFALCREILEGIRQYSMSYLEGRICLTLRDSIDRTQMIESMLNFAYSVAQKNPRVARAIRMRAADAKSAVNLICSVRFVVLSLWWLTSFVVDPYRRSSG